MTVGMVVKDVGGGVGGARHQPAYGMCGIIGREKQEIAVGEMARAGRASRIHLEDRE